MSTNRISALLPQALIDQTKTTALELANLWQPHFITVDPAEREGMATMGPARAAVAKDAEEIVGADPKLMPNYKNASDFRVDLENARQLRPTLALLRNVVHELDTLLLVSETEAYETALAIYAHVTDAAQREGSATAKAAAEKMATHFANRGRKRTRATS